MCTFFTKRTYIYDTPEMPKPLSEIFSESFFIFVGYFVQYCLVSISTRLFWIVLCHLCTRELEGCHFRIHSIRDKFEWISHLHLLNIHTGNTLVTHLIFRQTSLCIEVFSHSCTQLSTEREFLTTTSIETPIVKVWGK